MGNTREPSKLIKTLTITDNDEIKPRVGWREAFENLGELRPKGITILDAILDATAHGRSKLTDEEWQMIQLPTGSKSID